MYIKAAFIRPKKLKQINHCKFNQQFSILFYFNLIKNMMQSLICISHYLSLSIYIYIYTHTQLGLYIFGQKAQFMLF